MKIFGRLLALALGACLFHTAESAEIDHAIGHYRRVQVELDDVDAGTTYTLTLTDDKGNSVTQNVTPEQSGDDYKVLFRGLPILPREYSVTVTYDHPTSGTILVGTRPASTKDVLYLRFDEQFIDSLMEAASHPDVNFTPAQTNKGFNWLRRGVLIQYNRDLRRAQNEQKQQELEED